MDAESAALGSDIDSLVDGAGVRGGCRGRRSRGASRRARSVITRGRSRSRGGSRGRGSSRGRDAQAQREAVASATLEQKKEQTREIIAGLSEASMRDVLFNVVEKQPYLLLDILEARNQQSQQSPDEPEPHPGASNCPNWCVCTFCQEMPTDEENLCCGKEPSLCISRLANFQLLMLDEEVLDVARLYRQDILAFPPENDLNKGRRHAAYRQFTLWQHGRLGAGNRLVIPSCCVWRIRQKFPDRFGQYTGFIPGRLG